MMRGHRKQASKQLSVFLQHGASKGHLHGRDPCKHSWGIRQERHPRTTPETEETLLNKVCVIYRVMSLFCQAYFYSLPKKGIRGIMSCMWVTFGGEGGEERVRLRGGVEGSEGGRVWGISHFSGLQVHRSVGSQRGPISSMEK